MGVTANFLSATTWPEDNGTAEGNKIINLEFCAQLKYIANMEQKKKAERIHQQQNKKYQRKFFKQKEGDAKSNFGST